MRPLVAVDLGTDTLQDDLENIPVFPFPNLSLY